MLVAWLTESGRLQVRYRFRLEVWFYGFKFRLSGAGAFIFSK